jgi:heat shock transcription factor
MDPSNEAPNGGWGENLAELEQRALAAKTEAQAKRKQIPPFVQKVRSFLEESKNTDLIRWSDDGNSFIILDEDEFAKSLIPKLFKHNNYASFVRQLNVYGFHKKVGLSDNSMRASERKNKNPSEYVNPYFKRGHPDLLWLIQKPKNAPAQGSTSSGKGGVRTEEVEEKDGDDYVDDGTVPRGELSLSQCYLPKEQLAGVYSELQAIRQQQQIISNTISKLRREHEQLYDQAANFQEQHTRHENSINAILKFLASFYDLRLQCHERAQNLPNSDAISEDVDDADEYPLSAIGTELNRRFKKPQLLLKAPPPQQDPPTRTNTLPPPVGSTYDRSPHPLASPLPNNYSARLANTREAINSLAKMQAEQDRSVQNLTNLLQPLSPSGTIPGVSGDLQETIPPSLDLDQIFNSDDYFTDLPDMDKSAFGFGDSAGTALNWNARSSHASPGYIPNQYMT